ncbi:hypothetical protein BY996DRAFT_6458785 [Phakopsora pachyrhizi]|nr:hypothetical protein BY996DRAFT_6458785 [Phakopsora pachyrhizi]
MQYIICCHDGKHCFDVLKPNGQHISILIRRRGEQIKKHIKATATNLLIRSYGRASFEDELAKESIHLRIKIIRPAEPGEDEGYNNEDDEDDVKGHLMRASGRANTNNISNNDRARLADRNSSNTGWMAARRRG